MFGLGFSEMILIAIIALIFIGPKQLPEVARTLARFLNELKRASDDLTRSVHNTTSDINKSVSQKPIPNENKPSEDSIPKINQNSTSDSTTETSEQTILTHTTDVVNLPIDHHSETEPIEGNKK